MLSEVERKIDESNKSIEEFQNKYTQVQSENFKTKRGTSFFNCNLSICSHASYWVFTMSGPVLVNLYVLSLEGNSSEELGNVQSHANKCTSRDLTQVCMYRPDI